MTETGSRLPCFYFLLGKVRISPDPQPVRLFSHEERDRSYAGWNDAPLPSGARSVRSTRPAGIQRRRVRRQSSPTDRSRQAKLIQPLRIVIRNPPRQNLPLPSIRRNLESLQLLQNFQRASFTRCLRPRSHMLPSQQPPQELRRRDRLNLLAQHSNGQPMDAGQQPSLAPFNFGWLLVWARATRPRSLTRELSPEHSSRSLHPKQSHLYIGSRKAKLIPELRSRRRPNRRHPPHH